MKIINYLIAVMLLIDDIKSYLVRIISVHVKSKLFKFGMILPAVLGAVIASRFELVISVPICVILCFALLVIYSLIVNNLVTFFGKVIKVNLAKVVKLTWITSTRKRRWHFVLASVMVLVLYCLLYVTGISDLEVSLVLYALAVIGFYFWFIVNLNGGLTNE